MARSRKSPISTAIDKPAVEPLGAVEPDDSRAATPGLVLQPVENVIRKLSEKFTQEFGE